MANVTGTGALPGATVRAYYRDYVHADSIVATAVAAGDGSWTIAGLSQSSANTDYYIVFLDANGATQYQSIIVPSGAGPFVGSAILGTQRPPYVAPTGAGGLSQATADGLYSKKSNLALNVKDYGATGDGTTDDRLTIQAAFDAAASTGAQVYFPATSANYRVNGNLTIKSHMTYAGSGDGSRINFITGGFVWTGSRAVNIQFHKLNVWGYANNIFNGGAYGASQWIVNGCKFIQNNDSYSIWYQSNADSFIETVWEGCDFWITATATVPGFNIAGTAGALNNNEFKNCRLNGQGNKLVPFIRIAENGTTYTYNNRFTAINSENCPGGIIEGYSAQGWVLNTISHWDVLHDTNQNTFVRDAIFFGQGSGGSAPKSRDITITQYKRQAPANPSSGSIYDINCASAGFIDGTLTLVSCNTSGVSGISVNATNYTALNSVGLTQIADTQIFTGNGTWTKPLWAGPNATTRVILVSGGGGGGSGARQATGTAAQGGAGGGSSGKVEVVVPTSSLAATVSVTVGTGGAGGAAVTADTTLGNPGGTPGQTTFGALMAAGVGGTGGGGGTLTTNVGGTGGGSLIGSSATGGTGGVNGVVGVNGVAGTWSGSAAGGGGLTSANATSLGGSGRGGSTGLAGAPAGGATTGAAGTAGTSNTANSGLAGSSGGGGASGDAAGTVAGGAGGAGGLYGGAGGGGGGSRNGANSGAGGAGANGIAIIITSP